jgi:RimJ/RimL family protein N-acetyltransferase
MKITYRPIKLEDLHLRVKWYNNPQINKYLGEQIRNGTTLKNQKEWFEGYQKDKERKVFIIEAGKKPIGFVGFIEVKKIDRNAHIIIVIGEDEYRGKGMGKQALKFITDYGFKKLNLHKIYLHVYSPNIAAIKCYESFGFKKEAMLKEQAFINNQFCDEIVMSLFAK